MAYNPSSHSNPYAGNGSGRARAARRRRSASEVVPRQQAAPGPHARPDRPDRCRRAGRREDVRHSGHPSPQQASSRATRQARPGAEAYASRGTDMRVHRARPRGAASRGQGAMPQLSRLSAGSGYAPARRRNAGPVVPPAVIGIVVIAVLAVAGILVWSNRSVEVTLNGERSSVRIGSTVEEVIKEKKLEPKAGNLISVNGNVLEQGQGYAFMASLDGAEMDAATTAGYHAKAGDALDIADGRDRTEDYDVTTTDIQPKLEMGGEAWGNISYVSQWPRAGKQETRVGKVSGETSEGNVVQEAQNAVVSIHQIKPSGDQKLVALTFDDGPAEKYTEAYLDILNQYGIKATFFNLGQNIEEYPQLAKKVTEQGSEVMSHTYQHQQLSKLDAAALQKEFSDTFSTIESTTGVKTTSFRPPYGDFTEKAWLNSGGKASVSVLWNQDSLDWKRPGANTIVTNSLKGITSGSIILMHDGGGPRDQDVEALPQIIEQLQGQGYSFVTVSELMQSDDSIPDDIASGDATMPDDAVWPTELA